MRTVSCTNTHRFKGARGSSLLNSTARPASMAVEDVQRLSEQRLRDIVAFCADEEYHVPAQDHIRGLITLSTSL